MSDAEVIAAAETWFDGQISDFFFDLLARVSLVAVACFLPGRAKDLSAPRYFLDSREEHTFPDLNGSKHPPGNLVQFVGIYSKFFSSVALCCNFFCFLGGFGFFWGGGSSA